MVVALASRPSLEQDCDQRFGVWVQGLPRTLETKTGLGFRAPYTLKGPRLGDQGCEFQVRVGLRSRDESEYQDFVKSS